MHMFIGVCIAIPVLIVVIIIGRAVKFAVDDAREEG